VTDSPDSSLKVVVFGKSIFWAYENAGVKIVHITPRERRVAAE
jgi:hypothetical protein